MSIVVPARIGIAPCGCLHESLKRYRVLQMLRCPLHSDRFVLAEVVRGWAWCDSCRRRRARYRVTYPDCVAFLLCPECELPRSA